MPENTRIETRSVNTRLRTELVSRVWESPEAVSHSAVEYLPWPARVLSLTHRLGQGTMDVEVRINGVAVEMADGSSDGVSTSQSTITFEGPTRVADAGAKIEIVPSNLNGTPEHYAFTLVIERLPEASVEGIT